MSVDLRCGDALALLREMPDKCVQTCVTSPPYWGLRDYGVAGQLGLERTPEEYVAHMVEVFREVRRVLRDDGTLWLNLGDSYCATPNSWTGWDSSTLTMPHGRPRSIQIAQMASIRGGREFPNLKPKDLVGIPWRVAFALQADGWWLRSDIIWHKPNPMPESNKTRPTRSHEFIFLLTKSGKPLFWTHPEKDGVRKKPAPDYYYHNRDTLEDVIEPPEDWKTKRFVDTDGKEKRVWVRRNKWIGWNYFYDAEAIKEPVSESYRNDQRPLGVLRQRCNKKSKYHELGGQFKPLSRNEERMLSGKTGHFHEREKKQVAIGKATYADLNASGRGKDEILRNKRDVWKIATCQRKEAHFASFPDTLPEICIKAGTSEYGCCPSCGAPYMRVLKKVASTMNIRVRDNKKGIIDKKSGIGEQYGASEEEIEEYGEERAGTTETIGWRPTCSCNAGDPVPCVTLDPFMGRGTVALVSRELGRSSIGIELNPEYVEISKKNLTGDRAALDTGVVSYRFEKVPA